MGCGNSNEVGPTPERKVETTINEAPKT